ncbi:MAG: Ig-like domain-containing protein [Spirochaetales bacterium]|nr:Ig-like domain-containing protein [Spirochaetales bacterium]
MKKMLRIAAALAALLAMTNFIGCKNDDDDGGDETVAVTEVKITSTVKEVTAGETITLTAAVSPENATNKTVTWTSSDTAIATVKDGVVTGVKDGKVTITAKAGEKTATVEVTVKAAATSGGETGGSGSGETGGSTGGTTGGETGGETGTTTGFENTYWVLEKTSFEESGLKVTLENLEYIYIKDSTSGSSYAANPEGVIKGLSESSVGTHNLDYEEPITFTYTVDGSNVTIKVGEETITAVIVDENSFSTTDGSTATTYTYTKVAAAPTQATVTVEATAAPSTKTATIAYDGSSAENAPAATGEEGVFSDVQDVIATAGVAKGYSLDAGYPKYGSQTYTGDDTVKNGTTSAGMLIVSNLQDGATKVDFAANAVMAYVTYNFTLSAKSDVEAAVKAFNTQSSALAGKIEILDSNGILKVSKQAEAGSKSANDVTADSVELEAGVYILKFSWVTTKAAQLKKVNCGISSFSIKATTK